MIDYNLVMGHVLLILNYVLGGSNITYGLIYNDNIYIICGIIGIVLGYSIHYFLMIKEFE
jgi:hypothetical protein